MTSLVSKSKVVVRIGAGLGNQLFRYVAALRLSQESGREIRFDLTDFLLYHDRKYQLRHFKGPADIRHWNVFLSVLFLLSWLGKFLSVSCLHRAVLRTFKICRIEEPSAWEVSDMFLSAFRMDSRAILYLDGYYQNLAYLPDENVIRSELQWIHPFKKKSADELYRFLQTVNSVAVHVRRSDYITFNATDCLPETYYEDAMAYVERRTNNIKWIIFSDDPPWCRKAFDFIESPIFIEGNEPWEDLRLMTACKHHIIANSTFSWWGAFLKKEPGDSITVAPEFWLRGVRTDSCLLKKGWTTIPNRRT